MNELSKWVARFIKYSYYRPGHTNTDHCMVQYRPLYFPAYFVVTSKVVETTTDNDCVFSQLGFRKSPRCQVLATLSNLSCKSYLTVLLTINNIHL